MAGLPLASDSPTYLISPHFFLTSTKEIKTSTRSPSASNSQNLSFREQPPAQRSIQTYPFRQQNHELEATNQFAKRD